MRPTGPVTQERRCAPSSHQKWGTRQLKGLKGEWSSFVYLDQDSRMVRLNRRASCSATREQITETLQVDVASLADVIRSKEAAGREKDRAVLPILRQVLERSRSIDHEGPDIGLSSRITQDGSDQDNGPWPPGRSLAR